MSNDILEHTGDYSKVPWVSLCLSGHLIYDLCPKCISLDHALRSIDPMERHLGIWDISQVCIASF